jgi:hypothetical protein
LQVGKAGNWKTGNGQLCTYSTKVRTVAHFGDQRTVWAAADYSKCAAHPVWTSIPAFKDFPKIKKSGDLLFLLHLLFSRLNARQRYVAFVARLFISYVRYNVVVRRTNAM